MSFLKNAIDLVKMKTEEAQMRTPLQKALFRCTMSQDLITPIKDLKMICDSANHKDDIRVIMSFILQKLKRDNSKRVITKSLDLVKYLLLNGPRRIILEIRDEKYSIKSLRNLISKEDDYAEVEIIKKKSKDIIELLENEEHLEEEREKAESLNERYAAVGNSKGNNGDSYGSYGSKGQGGSSYKGYGSSNKGKKNNTSKNRTSNNNTSGSFGVTNKKRSLREKLGVKAEKTVELTAEPIIIEEKIRQVNNPTFSKPTNLLDDGEEDLFATKQAAVQSKKGLPTPPSKNKLMAPPMKGQKRGNNSNISKNTTFESGSQGLLGLDLTSGTNSVNNHNINNDNSLLGLDLTAIDTSVTNNQFGGFQQPSINQNQFGAFQQPQGMNGFGSFQQPNTQQNLQQQSMGGMINQFGNMNVPHNNGGLMDLTSLNQNQNQNTNTAQNMNSNAPSLLTYNMAPVKPTSPDLKKPKAQAMGNFTAEEAALFDLSSLTEEVNQKQEQVNQQQQNQYSLNMGGYGGQNMGGAGGNWNFNLQFIKFM